MNKHSINSSFREKLIEHLFIGEMLKLSWQLGDCQLEVLKPEVDNAGYDVVLEEKNKDGQAVIRHIQLKASAEGVTTSRQKIHIRLAEKQSGCMVWIIFDEKTLALNSFYYFGAKKAGEPLPSIEDFKVAKHSKANSTGKKSERPDVRVISKGKFTQYDNIEDLYLILFNTK